MTDYVLVSRELLDQILKNQDEIIQKLNNISNVKVPFKQSKYISEAEAKEILNKKTTWFWQQRTNGILPYSKVGNQIFYKAEDIDRLFEENLAKF